MAGYQRAGTRAAVPFRAPSLRREPAAPGRLGGRAGSRRAMFERSSKEGKKVRGAPRGSTPSKCEYQGALLCTPRDDNGGAFAECFGGGHEAGIRCFDGSHAQLLGAPLCGPSEPGAWEVLEEDKGEVPPLPGTAGAARGS